MPADRSSSRSRRQPGGFRIDASPKVAEALWESGWRVAPGFDAECDDCEGTGEGFGGDRQCRCGGLLWFPPGVVEVHSVAP